MIVMLRFFIILNFFCLGSICYQTAKTKNALLVSGSGLSSDCLAISSQIQGSLGDRGRDGSQDKGSDLQHNSDDILNENLPQAISEENPSKIQSALEAYESNPLFSWTDLSETDLIPCLYRIKIREISQKNFFQLLWYRLTSRGGETLKKVDSLINKCFVKDMVVDVQYVSNQMEELIKIKSFRFLQKSIRKKMVNKLMSLSLLNDNNSLRKDGSTLLTHLVDLKNWSLFKYFVDKMILKDDFKIKLGSLVDETGERDWVSIRSLLGIPDSKSENDISKQKNPSILPPAILPPAILPPAILPKAILNKLYRVLSQSSLEDFKQFVETNKIDIKEATNPDQLNILQMASLRGRLDIVTYLVVECHMNPNVSDGDGNSSLHWAVLTGRRDLAEFLVNHGADARFVNKDGVSVLQWASRKGRLDIVRYLVETLHVDPNAKDHYGDTAFLWACAYEQRSIVEYLIENGGNINDFNNSGESLLHSAAKKGNIEMVKYLISKGININVVGKTSLSLLQCAIFSGNINLVEYLITEKVDEDINASNNEGITAMHFAAATGNVHMIDYFVKKGFSVNVFDFKGRSPLYNIISAKDVLEKNKLECLKYLIEKGVLVDFHDNQGNTILHYIAESGSLEIMQYMLQKHVNFHITNDKKFQNRMIDKHDNLEIMKDVLQKDLDFRGNVHQETPLFWAGKNKRLEIVALLINHDCEVRELRQHAGAILSLAIRDGNVSLAQLIADKGRQWAQTMDDRRHGLYTDLLYAGSNNFFHDAVHSGNIEMVRYVYESHDWNVDLHSNKLMRQSLLYWSVENGQEEIAHFLIEKSEDAEGGDADLEEKDAEGHSLLHLAVKSQNFDLVHSFLGWFLSLHKDVSKDKNDEGRTPFYDAIGQGSLDIVDLFIGLGVKVKKRDAQGHSLLHLAVKSQNVEMVQYFLEDPLSKDIINDKNNEGITPLYDAIRQGSFAIVKLLIENGANVNQKDSHGVPFLHVAFLTEHEMSNKMAEIFIENGANLQETDVEGNTFMHYVFLNKDLTIFLYLLSNKRIDNTSINIKNNDGITPFHRAILRGDVRVVQDLINLGARIEEVDLEKMNCIHLGVSSGSVDMISYLLEMDLKKYIDLPNTNGETPLHLAIKMRNFNMVKHLIEKGVNLKEAKFDIERVFLWAVKNNDTTIAKRLFENGFTLDTTDRTQSEKVILSFHYAARKNHVDMVKLFISKGMDVKTKDNNGDTLLSHAVHNNNLELVTYLFDKQYVNVEDIDIMNTSGESPLFYAVTYGLVDMLHLLVFRGANLYQSNSSGKSLFHLAVDSRRVDMVSYLLDTDLKKDIDVPNPLGQTALHLAVWHKYWDMAQIFIEADADVSKQDNNGSTLLHYAMSNQFEDMISPLFDGNYIREDAIHTPNKMEETPLCWAVKNNCLNNVQILIDRNINVNGKNSQGIPFLHWAIQMGNVQMVNLLIEGDSNLEETDPDGNTFMHYLAMNPNFAIPSFLVESKKFVNKKSVNVRNKRGETPLHLAIKTRNFDMVKLLLENEVNIKEKDEQGNSVFQYAVRSNSVDMVKMFNLMDVRGAEVNWQSCFQEAVQNNSLGIIRYMMLFRDISLKGKGEVAGLYALSDNGDSLLHDAVNSGSADCLSYLLDYSWNSLNVKNKQGETPLHRAIKLKYSGIGKTLIENSANVNIKDIKGETPLHLAISHRCGEIVPSLLENGADVNTKNILGDTPLHLAIKMNDLELMDLLIKKKADVNEVNSKGETLLYFAVKNDATLEIVKYLVEHGVDVNIKIGFVSLLHQASEKRGNVKMIKYLVDVCHLDVNQQAYGETPLYWANLSDDKEIIQALIDRGADVNKGKSLLIDAILEKRTEIAKFLIEKNVDINAEYREGADPKKTPLHVAIEMNDLEMFKFLIDKKANIYLKNAKKETPLHLASKLGRKDMVEYLLEQGGNPNDDSVSHLSPPLNFAIRSGSEETVNVLLQYNANPDGLKGSMLPIKAVIKAGNFNMFQSLIRSKNITSGKLPDSWIIDKELLLMASESGNLDLFKYLCETKQFNMEYKDEDGESVLHKAAKRGDEGMIQYLIVVRNSKITKLDIQDKNNDGENLLHLASASGNFNLVKYLVQTNLFNFTDLATHKNTLLHLASQSGNLKMVKYLREQYTFDLGDKNSNGENLLHLASASGNLELVKYLCEEGLVTNEKTTDSMTPLQIAMEREKIDIAIYFLEQLYQKKINLNEYRLSNNKTLLLFAIEMKSFKLVEFLVTHGVEVNPTEESDISYLHVAAQSISSHFFDPNAMLYEDFNEDINEDNVGRKIFEYIAEKTNDFNIKREDADYLGAQDVLESTTGNRHDKILLILSKINMARAAEKAA